jgi:hypothetical protein
MIELSENGFILFKEKIIGESRILCFLGEPIVLNENFTLRSFFKMLSHYTVLSEIEAYLIDYVDLYRTHLMDLPFNNDNKMILFNSYLVHQPNKFLSIRHNLTLKGLETSNQYSVDFFDIENIIDCKIDIVKKIKTYKLENNKFNRLSDNYTVDYPTNLFEFIIWTSGSLFKGKTPIDRKEFVIQKNEKIEQASASVMEEINSLLNK